MLTASDEQAQRTREALPPSRPSTIGPLFLLILLAGAIASVVVFLDRGIDLTDESYYLLGYAHPRDVFLTLSHFHSLVAALTGGRAWPVLFYRVLALTLGLAAPIFLAIRLHRFGQPAGADRSGRRVLALSAYTALGGMMCYTLGARALSYNGLVSALVLIEAGLLLAFLEAQASGPIRRMALALLLGLVGSALIPVKATSAALMGVWIVGAGAWLGLGGARRWLELAAGAALGAALFAAAFFGGMIPFHDWWNGVSIMRESMTAHYSMAALARSSLMPLLGQLEVAGPPMLVAVGLVMWGAHLAGAKRWRAGMACMWLGVLVPTSATLLGHFMSGNDPFGVHEGTWVASLVTVSVTIWLEARARRPSLAPGGTIEPRRTRLIALLLALPLVAAVGTNNPLSIQVQLYLAPWFAVLWLISEGMPSGQGRTATKFLAIATGLLAVWLIGWFQIVRPYRIPGGMREQTMSFSSRIVAGRGLRVDASTRELVETTRDLLDQNGFRPGDPIIALYDLPGLVYLVGGRAPKLPWIYSRSDTLACRAIALMSEEVAHHRVFVFTRGPLSKPVIESLSSAGLGSDVIFLGAVESERFGKVDVFAHTPPE